MTTDAFRRVNDAAGPALAHLVQRLLPQGRRMGRYWVALNPTRHDRNLGSFKVDLETGQWADYATDDRGGDVISLVAYAYGLSQGEAKVLVAQAVGVGNDR